ncbi:hypothetical protein C5167_003630 [Papaver somniferum]|uniref:Dihydroorotate dehydrogenase catalytic domain-containing protein n=1 Tax=Papaver somniferum TaxID=3469 RepID=A0A4Y7L1J7_PAPSO|nr:dihydroorotate dehydrogenase (quinone), mitochondrial-like [Papaver somniferum]RZC79424.1 hypothetical protein C5167_003630 [Papaver somniferum]
MAARASSNYIKNLLFQNSTIGAFGGLGAVRHSTSVPKICPKIPQLPKKGRIFTAAFLGIVISGGAYVSTVNEATSCGWLFSATKLVNPFFAYLNAETAHRLAVAEAAARGWLPKEKRPDPLILGMEVWGRKISSPIGLSAGFDKNAEAVEGLLAMGFGFIEIGSSDEVPHGGKAGPDILGVNLGKNNTSEDTAADYIQGVHTSSQYAYYLVINISSPNTPGLCMLQGREQLEDLVKKVKATRDDMQWGEEGPPPVLVKIDPYLPKLDLEDIAAVALTLRLDGLIVTDTTIARPDPARENPVSEETGGLSGKPLFVLGTNVLSYLCLLTRGKVSLYGCGGISKHKAIDIFPYYNSKRKHEQHYQHPPCDRPCNCVYACSHCPCSCPCLVK